MRWAAEWAWGGRSTAVRAGGVICFIRVILRGRREESKIIFLIMHSRVKILRDRA